MALDISLVGFEEVRRPETHVEFTILVKAQGWSHTVAHRYSDFESLHKELKLRYLLSPRMKLPKLPGKQRVKTVLGGLGSADLEKRRASLEGYLRALESNPTSWESQCFAAFLELPESIRHGWLHHHISSSFLSGSRSPSV